MVDDFLGYLPSVILVALLLFVGVFPASVSAGDIYVNDGEDPGDSWTISQAGSDTHAGTNPDTPVRTIQQALEIAGDTLSGDPSHRILLGAGDFDGGHSIDTDNIQILGSDTTALDTTAININTTGNRGFGVTANNVSFKHLSVESFENGGIQVDGADGFTASNINIKSTNDTGLGLVDAANATADSVVLQGNTGNGLGIGGGSSNNTISNVRSQNNAVGFKVVNSSKNLLKSDTALGNGNFGVVFQSTSGDTLVNSKVKDSDEGIFILESDNLLIRENIVRDNSDIAGVGRGVFIQDSNKPTLRGNQSLNNGSWGLEADSAPGGYYRENLLADNGEGGFLITDGINSTMRLNETRNDGLGSNQLRIEGSTSFDTIVNNNFLQLNNTVDNNTGSSIDMSANYWNTADSDQISGVTDGPIVFKPFRLSIIDTKATDPLDQSAPRRPNQVTADTSTADQVILSWNKPGGRQNGFDDSRDRGARIYRSTDRSISNWTTEADSVFVIEDSNDTTFTDNEVAENETYFYRITTFDSHVRDSRNFENESFFSRIIKAAPEQFGPEIYVNDDTTAGDVFTDRAGDDTKNGTAKYPLKTLDRAVQVAQGGDTIILDSGTYTDTTAIDTGGITVRGAGPENTVFDGQGSDTPIRTDLTSGTFAVFRNFTVKNSPVGMNLSNVGKAELINLEIKGNTTGILVPGSNNRITNTLFRNNQVGLKLLSGPNFVAQNQFDSNVTYQISVDATTNNDILRNNIVTSAANPDSGVELLSGDPKFTFNWWTTADSEAIADQQSDTVNYIPHRLGEVDTGVNADSTAPAIDTSAIDTSTAQQIEISWSQPTSDEDGSGLSDLDGYRIYRIKNTLDTPDWTQETRAVINDPATTSFVDTDIEKKQTYRYRVTAFDGHVPENESYFTSILSGTWVNRVPVADSPTIELQRDSDVTFNLTGSDADGDTIRFFIDDNNDGDSLVLPSQGSLDASAFSPTNPELTYSPNANFGGSDTFSFVVRDADTVSDTGVVTLRVLTKNNIRARSLQVGGDTPAFEAGSGGTIPVRTVYENTKSGPGEVQRALDDISILNAVGTERSDSFAVTLSGTDVRVDGNDTAVAEWGIDVPSGGNKNLVGNFSVRYEVGEVAVRNTLTNDTDTLGDSIPGANLGTMNVVPDGLIVDSAQSDSGLDTVSVDVQSVRLRGGLVDSDKALDDGSLNDGDSVIRMIQRGGTDTIDTPITNPAYNFQTADTFDKRLNDAFQQLKTKNFPGEDSDFGRNLTVLNDNLLLISLWKNSVLTGNYLGDSDVIRERSTVIVDDVDFQGQQERLNVVKLLSENDEWVLIDKLNDVNDVTGSPGDYRVRFDVSADETQSGAGFSVFQIIATGVADQGDAKEAIAYPNPYVPHEGGPNTGQACSGTCGDGEGIYFGAGKDRGFPPGSEIEIFNVKGERIARFSLNNGGILQWDARTGNGEPVASGVYVFRVETPDGEQKIGKFAVVR